MNLFECCLLFGLVSVASSQFLSVCKPIGSSLCRENEGDANSTLVYKEMQNSKGDAGQKGDKGNNGSTGETGTKGDPGEVNMTEIHELQMQFEQGEFHGRYSQ